MEDNNMMAEELGNALGNEQESDELDFGNEDGNGSSGLETVVTGIVATAAGFFGGKSWGYKKACKDIAEATGKDVTDVLAVAKGNKEKKKSDKKKTGKLAFRSPFYREEVVEEEPKPEKKATKTKSKTKKQPVKKAKGKEPEAKAE